jgi:hypothetical protein
MVKNMIVDGSMVTVKLTNKETRSELIYMRGSYQPLFTLILFGK